MFVFYDECVLSYIGAIRNYLGLDSSFKPNQKFKEYLDETKPERIFVTLIDAMGANQINRKLSKDAFLNKNQKYRVQTVFPSTTTAAVTAISNGKAPNENAWLGWQEYVEEKDRVMIPFLGCDYYDPNVSFGRNFFYDLIPFKTTNDELSEKGFKAREFYPDFKPDGYHDHEDMIKRLIDFSKEDYKYVFTYIDTYDSTCHIYGPSAKESDDCLNDLNEKMERLSKSLKDGTLHVIVADHGQVDIHKYNYIVGSKYEKYMYRKPCIEPRTPGFYIKEEYREEFEKNFKQDFENEHILLSKQDIIQTKLFGTNKDHPRFLSLLPDYIAIAKSDSIFLWEKGADPEPKGMHAGICEDELYTPIIVYKN